MRWNKNRTVKNAADWSEWYKTFIILPVVIEDKWVCFEIVEERFYRDIFGNKVYSWRFIKKEET